MSHVLILRAPGTNCDRETAYAFESAGAKTVEIRHLNRLLERPALLQRADILCIPGGFSFGDDIAAGRIFASMIRNHLGDVFRAFHESGKLILGICNGFQVLLKAGLLFDEDAAGPPATLTWNSRPLYTNRWVRLRTGDSDCVFLRDIESMYLPIAHAEGRFVFRSEAERETLLAGRQLALRYHADDNPNGSTLDVAGACDPTGRIFGLMPHPERHLDAFQHPQWTRKSNRRDTLQHGDGLALFRNAVAFFQ